MKPIEFPEQNIVIAKDQPQYLQLPAHYGDEGEVTSCWQLSWRERLTILFTGQLWWCVLTFGHPLQPQKPLVECPFDRKRTWVDAAIGWMKAAENRLAKLHETRRVRLGQQIKPDRDMSDPPLA